MSLFRYFGREKVKDGGDNNNSEATKKDDDQNNTMGVSKSTAELAEAQESKKKKDFVRFKSRGRLVDPGWNFTRKKTLCFVVIADGFLRVNLHFGSQKGNNSFRLDGIKKHEISEAHKTAKLPHGPRQSKTTLLAVVPGELEDEFEQWFPAN